MRVYLYSYMYVIFRCADCNLSEEMHARSQSYTPQATIINTMVEAASTPPVAIKPILGAITPILGSLVSKTTCAQQEFVIPITATGTKHAYT